MSLEPYDLTDPDGFYEEDQFVADLFNVYVNRRRHGRPLDLHGLLWRAAQHGPNAARTLRTVLGLYEAARTYRQAAQIPQR
jgi:hypothetical protein